MFEELGWQAGEEWMILLKEWDRSILSDRWPGPEPDQVQFAWVSVN